MLPAEEQLRIIKSGRGRHHSRRAAVEKLKRNKPLNIKLGVDPTAPDIHIGHAVPLRKLRQFQDLGHQVTLIIGDGTALIGDPSGRNTTRLPAHQRAEIDENAQTYIDQAFKILDPSTTLRHNSEVAVQADLAGLLKLVQLLWAAFSRARRLPQPLQQQPAHQRARISLPGSCRFCRLGRHHSRRRTPAAPTSSFQPARRPRAHGEDGPRAPGLPHAPAA